MAGRHKKPDKKIQINVKLPPYLIRWLNSQKESNAKLIEDALIKIHLIK